MKFVCQVCGYVFEGEAAPEKCPQCGAPAGKFSAQTGGLEWAAEIGRASCRERVSASV